MGFGGITNIITEIQNGLSTVVGGLYLLAVTVGVIAIVVLSIITMFCDEQSAQRYKRWRTNVIKAVVVALLIAAVFSFIKGIFGSYWGQTDFQSLT